MKVKLIIISIILLLVMVFASGCIPVMEKLGLVNPTDEEQLSSEKGGPPDGLVKVLIGFKEKPGAAQQAMVRSVGGKIKYTYHIVDAIAASIPEKAIEALQKNPNVTHVELDIKVYALDTELDNSWGVKHIGAGIVHDFGNRGAGVNVAIIDSGIDYAHPDLAANYAGGWDFVNDDDDPMDDDGHGTHVAGTVAARDDGKGVVGVAPEASLYALKVLGPNGSGSYSDVIAAIDWCVVNSIRVTNNSYGSSGDPGNTVKAAFDNSEAAGVLHVAAAGNSGNPPGRGDNIIYPARYESVIAVAATNKDNERARWSSTGPDVELAAPGVDINSTLLGGGYGEGSGTSMASPHVAGVVALVIKAGTSLDVRTQLQTTADDLGDPGKDDMYGYGLVNAVKAALEPVDIHDVAVTAISAPLWVLQGDMVNVDVDVANEGTFNETFDVVLTVIPDGFTNTKTITFAAGASTTISFLWQTLELTDLGDHTLTATADLTTDEDTTDNSKFTIVTVVEAVTNMMYVESIEFDSKVAGPNKFLYTIIKVVDGGGNPLGGVRVEMTLDWNKESNETIDDSWNFAGNTDVDGMVKFTQKKALDGSYTATVTGLTLSGYDWNKELGVTSASHTLK
jgi:subtilisin family serine protease